MIGKSKIVAVGVAILAGVLPWPHPGRRTGACTTPLWEIGHDFISYMYALQLETEWHRAQPRTKSELEQHLRLYATKPIVPAESCWGRWHALRPGDSMLQYQILWHAPLDVVYDSTGRIVVIFTSYE
jgi:hypothetical protein